jgi:peptide chain release factor subunit 1
MSISAKEQYKLKKLIKELSTYRGRHTELVTVYVPAGYDLNKIISHLQQEQGTATNIKSASTRKNVVDGLERMIQHLKLYKKTPENGLCVFSGNVAEREGQSDVKVWSFEPPVPLNQRIYRCDKTFVLEALEDMIEVKEVYGLVVLDLRDGDIALLKGKTIIPLQSTHSEVPGKHKTGGQSAQRFERLRDGAAFEHYKKIAEYMKNQFLTMTNLKGIIIGGPGSTISSFMEKNYLTGDLKKKILGTKDLSYTGDFGLQELLEKSSDILASEEVSHEKQIMQKFFGYLATKPGMVSYGEDHVKTHLKMGAVDSLLISENLDDEKIEEFEELATEQGTTVEIISTETREGVQLRDMGMIAAILRYDVDH